LQFLLESKKDMTDKLPSDGKIPLQESHSEPADANASQAPRRTRRDYDIALEQFDVAVCEASAVSQAAAGRFVAAHLAYGTHVFTVICGQAVAMVRAAPLSRWTRSDFQVWTPSTLAGYARAIIEGQLLLTYLMETPESQIAWSAKLNVMHLNDCTRRITLFTNMGALDEIDGFLLEASRLKGLLRTNEYFCALLPQVQRRCLEGESPMIATRQEMLEKVGWEKGHFRALFDLLSQHAHILPLSFYRLEPNGRGTGLENEADRGSLCTMLETCAEVLAQCTDLMVAAFPDAAAKRQGKKSKFSPGPRGNLPR
jgi:hypothetical protein